VTGALGLLDLRRSGFLAREDFTAVTVEDAQSDRPRRPRGARGGYDRSGAVRRFDVFLGQIRRAVVGRTADKLDPKRLWWLRDDPGRLGDWIKFEKRRALCGVEVVALCRSLGDD
jgi:hypothetical protein